MVQDDGEVLDELMDLACQPPDPAMEALSAQGCTGGNVQSNLSELVERLSGPKHQKVVARNGTKLQ